MPFFSPFSFINFFFPPLLYLFHCFKSHFSPSPKSLHRCFSPYNHSRITSEIRETEYIYNSLACSESSFFFNFIYIYIFTLFQTSTLSLSLSFALLEIRKLFNCGKSLVCTFKNSLFSSDFMYIQDYPSKLGLKVL